VLLGLGLRICKREAGEGVGAKIPKLSAVAQFRARRETAAAEGDGGRRWRDVDEVGVVVGQRVCQHEAGEGVGGQKPRN
jgi:hypothetical protein